MYLKSISVRGYRASAASDVTCDLPGRFTLLVGGNNAGKTTICEAVYLAHSKRFPQLARPSAELLRRARDGDRELSMSYVLDENPATEGPFGRILARDAIAPPTFTKFLERSLGKVRVRGSSDEPDGLRVIYLPAQRNPVDELARREADILVELLRAAQQRATGHRNLGALRTRAEHLLEQITGEELVRSLETRVQEIMNRLTAGVSSQVPFLGAQRVDDQFLARVLELLLAVGLERSTGRRLEVSGLGYANLLHIAVTLAAIPDLTEASAKDTAADADANVVQAAANGTAGTDVAIDQVSEADAAIAALSEADDRAEAAEDSFFAGPFHAVVVIEEPEAHLHPQLQHGLIRYLRRVVDARPELQIVVSSHAPDLIAAVDPHEVVLLRTTVAGRRALSIAELPELPGSEVNSDLALRMAALHLDASRSSALFGERILLVEGITDALLVRKLGRHWAAAGEARDSFVDALSIVPVGSRVGEWPVRFLATPGFELAARVAVLTDSDKRHIGPPKPPAWVALYPEGTLRYVQSHPTLEPSLATEPMRAVLEHALTGIGVAPEGAYGADYVDALFRGKHIVDGVAIDAGAAAGKKGEFAFSLAGRLDELPAGSLTIPAHVEELFDYLFSGLESPPIDTADGAADGDGAGAASPDEVGGVGGVGDPPPEDGQPGPAGGTA